MRWHTVWPQDKLVALVRQANRFIFVRRLKCRAECNAAHRISSWRPLASRLFGHGIESIGLGECIMKGSEKLFNIGLSLALATATFFSGCEQPGADSLPRSSESNEDAADQGSDTKSEDAQKSQGSGY